jgi:hypothetical protein
VERTIEARHTSLGIGKNFQRVTRKLDSDAAVSDLAAPHALSHSLPDFFPQKFAKRPTIIFVCSAQEGWPLRHFIHLYTAHPPDSVWYLDARRCQRLNNRSIALCPIDHRPIVVDRPPDTPAEPGTGSPSPKGHGFPAFDGPQSFFSDQVLQCGMLQRPVGIETLQLAVLMLQFLQPFDVRGL